jgi:small-conductance mechanosensitive channel
MAGKIYDIVEPWLASAVIVVAAVALAFIAHRIAFAALARLARRTEGEIDDALVRHGRRPAWLIVTLFALVLALPNLDLPDDIRASAGQILSALLTAAFGWLAFSLTRSLNDVVAARYDITAADNLRAREIYTRVRVLQRILAAAILAVTASVILMAIPEIRQIGITLFASAGVAGIVAGLAARPVLSNLLAGLQLALTQPIRIDDVVIVEGEWGWIEEIRSTFVIIRIWDLRRLVVPLTYFIETPFQNWTRKSADILGTVFLYAD